MESRKDPLHLHSCDFCGYGTKSLSTILQHETQHQRKLEDYSNIFGCHNDVSQYYKCVECDFPFDLRVSLTNHFNQNHKNPRNENEFICAKRKCEYCDFQTYSTLVLLKHYAKCDESENLERNGIYINGQECGQCSYKTHDKCKLRAHIKNLHSTWYRCERCSFKTKFKINLKQHINTNHRDLKDIEWLKCDNCLFQTKCKNCYQGHKSVRHVKKSLECPNCRFPASSTVDLEKHFRYKHGDLDIKEYWQSLLNSNKEVSYPCGKCDYSKWINDVWYHCDKCEHKAKTKTDLTRHIGIVHILDSRKREARLKLHMPRHGLMWHCDKCEFKSKWKNALNEHVMSVHTNSANIVWYYCHECEFKAKRKEAIEKHTEDIHTKSPDIVWYHCQKCDYRSKCEEDLQIHTMNDIHTNSANIVWYHCDICEYSTKWISKLKQHVASVHIDSANIVNIT